MYLKSSLTFLPYGAKLARVGRQPRVLIQVSVFQSLPKVLAFPEAFPECFTERGILGLARVPVPRSVETRPPRSPLREQACGAFEVRGFLQSGPYRTLHTRVMEGDQRERGAVGGSSGEGSSGTLVPMANLILTEGNEERE